MSLVIDRHGSHTASGHHKLHPHSAGSGTALSRRFSLSASVRRAALEEEHEVALEHFKTRIAQAGLHLPPALLINGDLDATLLRFLRARKYHVDAALAMLEKSLLWRRKAQADSALEHPLEPQLMQLVRECRPSSYIGFDSQHHPIFVERLGKLDGVRIEKMGVADETILAYHLREMEFMQQVVFREASEAAGHTIDRVISIMDANGLTLSKLTGFAQRLFRLITAMDSDNYPETCHAIYIVNGGVAFGAIWRLVSPFVDKGTRDKVHVVGSGKYMQQHLFSGIGREMTPTFLGGGLDFESVARGWWDKMDAAMAERAAHPLGPQQPVVLQLPPSLTNGHHAADHHHQQQHRGSFTGSFTGLRLPKLSHFGSGLHRHSTDSTDTFGTPMSNASRFSATSGCSVYFDACEASEAPGGAASPSPPSSLTGIDPFHAHAAASSSSPMPGSSPRHTAAGLISSGGGGGAGACGGNSSPFAAASTPGGSMSVGPQSCSRSQLSGFTAAHGPGGGHGAGGRHAEMHEVDGLSGVGIDEEMQVGGPGYDSSQPRCGCGCVIS